MSLKKIYSAIAEHGADVRPWLSIYLRELTPEELGLPEKMANLNRDQGWQCEDLFQVDDFHCAMFMVPEGHVLPIHDHPKMSVWFRTLWGTLELHAYDWFQPWPMSGWAVDRGVQQLDGASPTQVILPEHHNLHQIRALTDCAFVDLFCPGYDEEERPCHYFSASEQHPEIPALRRLNVRPQA